MRGRATVTAALPRRSPSSPHNDDGWPFEGAERAPREAVEVEAAAALVLACALGADAEETDPFDADAEDPEAEGPEVCLVDLCRQSITFESPGDVSTCLAAIAADPAVAVARIKNRLDPQYDTTYLIF